MGRRSIYCILGLPLLIMVAISAMVLICQSSSSGGVWSAIERFIHSIQNPFYSDNILAEMTPLNHGDQLNSDNMQGAPDKQTDENGAEQRITSFDMDYSPKRYYVSKLGNNRDGLSWDTAWNELDQINWDVVEPGDTILVDGGRFEMVYSSQLTISKSGLYLMPITIKMATESGRNGQVVIFGGRSTPLPYCHQNNYVLQTHDVGKIGILIDGVSWIVIDGTRWSGILVHGHNESGIRLSNGSEDITIRNLEVFDNGTAKIQGSGWNPDSAGISFSGVNLTFERMIVHDNGQDAFQSDGGNENFILRQSWLYNARRHPDVDESFNYCTHTDGLQIYNGGHQRGFLIEETIIGPGFTNGLILGSLSSQTYAVIDQVTLRNVLLTKTADNTILSYPNTAPQGWILDHITADCSNTKYECLHLEGFDHIVANSIFWGAKIQIPDLQFEVNNNCQWETSGNDVGQVADPLFEDMNATEPFSLDDFTLKTESDCTGMGSSITSVGQLFYQEDPDGLLEGYTWDADEAYISFPFYQEQDFLFQQIETDDPGLGGRASFRFNIPSPGSYLVETIVDAPDAASNSFFVSIDQEPTNPRMIWDIAITTNFEERIVSWRGSGTDLENEFSPKIFELTSGTHELIIVGREANVRLKEVRIIQHSSIQDIHQTDPYSGGSWIKAEPSL